MHFSPTRIRLPLLRLRCFTSLAPASPPVTSLTALQSQHSEFLSIYGPDPIYAWMSSYYRRPHPEYLPSVFLESALTPGSLQGPQALPFAAFLASVLRRSCSSEADFDGVLAACAGALCAAHGEGGPRAELLVGGEERLDTVLRALSLADMPAADAVLQRTSGAWASALAAGWARTDAGAGADASAPPPGAPPGWEQASREDILALAASLGPRTPPRPRAHLLHWPLPLLNLDAFTRDLRQQPFPLYAASRHLFARTRALHTLASSTSASSASSAATLALLVPPLAQEVTCAMVDGLWGHFYATGDSAAIERVLDVATGYADFLEEFGQQPFTAPSGAYPLPPALADSPYAAARFEASRHALLTLLWHCERHTAVGDALGAAFSALNDRAVLAEVGQRVGGEEEEGITAFGRARLDLLHHLHPTLQALAARAWQGGIGSGQWPAAYSRLHGEVGERGGQLLLQQQQHLGRPALPLSAFGCLLSQGAAWWSCPLWTSPCPTMP